MRPRPLILFFLLAAVVLWPTSAGAQESPTPTTVPPGAVGIGDGLSFSGAVVTTEGAKPVSWDANQAAVFVQSWLPGSIYNPPILQDPPKDLPVYRLDVSGTWGSGPGTITLYYASDGTQAWVAYPRDQAPRATVEGAAPAPSNWFQAPDRTVGAFNGTEKLVLTEGVEQASGTTTPGRAKEEAGSPSGDDDDNAALIGIAVLAVLLAGISVVLIRTRRAKTASA